MKKKVAQLKLFLESIAEHDEALIAGVSDAVSIIFEGEEDKSGKYSDADMAIYNKIKGSIAGGFDTLPKDVKEKVAKRKGLTLAQIDKAIKMWDELNPDKDEFKVASK